MWKLRSALPMLATLASVNQAMAASLRSANANPFAGCACCGSLIGIPIALFVINIAILVWVARDAKARGMDNAVLWMILVLFTSFVGLLIYILSRPKGNLVPCPNCANQRLQASIRCPHCGA